MTKLKLDDATITALLHEIQMPVLYGNDAFDGLLDQIRASDYVQPDKCEFTHAHTRTWCRNVLCRKS